MKAFSRKVTKLFKKDIKQDIMFFCSLLANASTLEVFEDVLHHSFIIILFPLETEIFQKSLATLFSDAENMTDFKILLKFENEEEVRDFLEDENKKERDDNQTEADLTKDDLLTQNYYETDEDVNKGKQESKGRVTQDLDNDFEEISDEKKTPAKSKNGIFYLK